MGPVGVASIASTTCIARGMAAGAHALVHAATALTVVADGCWAVSRQHTGGSPIQPAYIVALHDLAEDDVAAVQPAGATATHTYGLPRSQQCELCMHACFTSADGCPLPTAPACPPTHQGVGTVVMKNWLPLVLGPALACTHRERQRRARRSPLPADARLLLAGMQRCFGPTHPGPSHPPCSAGPAWCACAQTTRRGRCGRRWTCRRCRCLR